MVQVELFRSNKRSIAQLRLSLMCTDIVFNLQTIACIRFRRKVAHSPSIDILNSYIGRRSLASSSFILINSNFAASFHLYAFRNISISNLPSSELNANTFKASLSFLQYVAIAIDLATAVIPQLLGPSN